MINLRYHIVSITAVFLALGIGVAMGSTLIQRATIDTLERRLDDQQERLETTDAENEELSAQLAARDVIADQFDAQANEQLLLGRLVDVPVILFAAEGISDGAVDGLRDALINSGSDFAGAFRTTPRLALENPDDISDLAVVLEMSSSAPDELRDVLIRRLGDALLRAAEVPETDDTPLITVPPAETTTLPAEATTVPPSPPTTSSAPVGPTTTARPKPTTTTTTTTLPVPDEVAVGLIQGLVFNGFLVYEPPPTGAPETSPVPIDSARYVFLSGEGAELADDDFFLPLSLRLTERSETVAPLVAADDSGADALAAALAAVAGEEDPAPDDSAESLVGTLRADPMTEAKLSTVDSSESFAGWAAAVLALEQLSELKVGSYGIAPTADRILPAPT